VILSCLFASHAKELVLLNDVFSDKRIALLMSEWHVNSYIPAGYWVYWRKWPKFFLTRNHLGRGRNLSDGLNRRPTWCWTDTDQIDISHCLVLSITAGRHMIELLLSVASRSDHAGVYWSSLCSASITDFIQQTSWEADGSTKSGLCLP
jgi:hypothetical protein